MKLFCIFQILQLHHGLAPFKVSVRKGENWVKLFCIFQILQLHPGLAPFKVSVIASGEKGRELGEVATYISRELRANGIKLLDTRDATDGLENSLSRFVLKYDVDGHYKNTPMQYTFLDL